MNKRETGPEFFGALQFHCAFLVQLKRNGLSNKVRRELAEQTIDEIAALLKEIDAARNAGTLWRI